MFNKTEEYKLIKRELEVIKSINKIAKFSCFGDSIITYSLKDGAINHEFNIIADDTFFYEMTIIDLLSLKRITYFSHSIYFDNKKEAERSWNINEHISKN